MKKKKVPEPTVTPKDAGNLELFQAQHGEEWQRITVHPAFLAALQLLNVRAFNELLSFSFEDIKNHGSEITSVLVGRLRMENDMKMLHKEQTFTFPVEDGEVDYESPEEQAAREQLRQRFVEERKKQRYGN